MINIRAFFISVGVMNHSLPDLYILDGGRPNRDRGGDRGGDRGRVNKRRDYDDRPPRRVNLFLICSFHG